MNRGIILLCFAFLYFGTASSQNMVLNPSFEQTNTNCSQLGGEGFRQDLSGTWDNANSNVPGDSCSSPDLFSACNTLPIIGGPSPFHMPDGGAQGLGYQWSRTGSRHAGFIVHSAPFGIVDNYREYIQGQLSAPLTAGQTYCVSMYVSLGEAMPFATNNIGVYFGSTQYLRDACTAGSGIFNLTPQLNYGCAPITDTSANWVRLQWDYVASGGEQWMLIGNFYNSAATTVANTGHGAELMPGTYMHPFAYYFIDDVSVVSGSCCAASINRIPPTCITDAAFNLVARPPLSSNCSPPPLSGTWSGTGITNASIGTFDPSVAGAGTHVITFSLPCGVADTVHITVNPCSMLNVCRESNGNLTASGGSAPYIWSQWSTGGTIQITDQASCTQCGLTWSSPFPGFPAGCGFPPVESCTSAPGYVQFGTGATIALPTTPSYPIQVTDNSGGSYTINSAADVAALSPCNMNCPAIDLRPSVQHIACNGLNTGAISLSPNGGTAPYTFTWSPNVGTTASVSNLAAGTYSVTVRDANQCTATASFTITEPLVLNASVAQTTMIGCGQGTGSIKLAVSGGSPNYTFTWNPNVSSTDSAGNLTAGTYRVTVTDQNGCTDTTSATITATTGVSINSVVKTDTRCGGNNGTVKLNVTGGSAPLTYVWTPNVSTTDTAGNLTAGTYNITVSDASGCSATATTTVNPSSSVTVSLQNKRDVNCNDTDGFIKVLATGTGSITYTWSPNVGTTDSVFNLPSGTYNVTVTDVNNCSASTSVQIQQINGVNASIQTQTNPSCGQNNGFIEINATGAATPFVYVWTPNVGTGNTASNLAGGVYGVTITDANNCSTTVSTTLNATPAVSIDDAIVYQSCGVNSGAIRIFVSGGNGSAYTYTWTPNVGSTDSVSNLAAGNYSVIVSDATGCSATASYNVTVNTPPVVTFAGDSSYCTGGSAALSASGGVSYIWNNGNISSSINVTAGVYSVTATDVNGCTGVASVTINENPRPAISISGVPTVYCEGTSVILAAAGGASYLWSDNSTDNTLTISASGNYSVTGTDVNGCSASSSVSIDPSSVLGTITLPDTVGVCEGDSILLDATTANALSYLWNTGDTTSSVSINTSNVYVVTVSNACETKTASVIATFQGCACDFKLPTAFSPNGDGNNDEYKIVYRCNNIISVNIRIYNRWGEKVFETDSVNIGWDGIYKGSPQPLDVFVAYVSVTYEVDNKRKTFSQMESVTLLR